MPINTKFDTGDYAFLAEKARIGIMAKVKIIRIKTEVVSGSTSTKYQIYSPLVYNNTFYPEDQLLTFAESKEIALAYMSREISNITLRQSDLEGDFKPIGTTLNVI